jgi:chaperonin GroEL
VTLGPKGRNVVIDKKFGSPTVTKDGVTVAKEIELPDPSRTWAPRWSRRSPPRPPTRRRRHHDGHRARRGIYREGLKNVTAGANPMDLKRGIDKAVEAAVAELAKISKKVKTARRSPGRHRLRQLGRDHRQHHRRGHGQGRQGRHITVEEAKTIETTLDVVEGMQFDKGYLSPYFVTNAEAMEACSRTPTSSSTRRRSAR